MQLKQLYESIRSKSKLKFNWNKFRSIENRYKQLKYADTRLKLLGRGSSRSVYVLTSKYVLKIASESNQLIGAGVAQNETEVNAYTTPNIKPIVAKIYAFDKDYNWLVSELARPIKDIREISSYFNIKPLELFKTEYYMSIFVKDYEYFLKK